MAVVVEDMYFAMIRSGVWKDHSGSEMEYNSGAGGQDRVYVWRQEIFAV